MTWKITLTIDDPGIALDTFVALRHAHSADAVDIVNSDDDDIELEQFEEADPPPFTVRLPRDVACPKCGAAAGQPCRTVRGTVYHYPYDHKARKDARYGAQ